MNKLKATLFSVILIFFSCFNTTDPKIETVDLIIKNGLVLTMNSEKEIIENGVVVINNSKIIDVGSSDLLEIYSGRIIDADKGIIMPGMINAHTHAAMSVFRSLADDVPDRLNRFIFPLENRMVDEDLVYVGTKHGAIEMLRGGVTTMVDMYLFEESAAEAIKDVGMRGILTQNIIRFPTADGESSDELIDRAIQFVEKYKDDDLITPGFGPHATHTVVKDDLIRIRDLSEHYDVPVSLHVAETVDEYDHFMDEYNMTPVEYLDSIGLLNHRLIAAHSIFVTESDIDLIKKRDVGVSHNMIANIKSAKGVSPALEMYDKGVRVGLGTDGPMSGNTLDIIRQMGYVATLHKLVNEDRSLMPPPKVVDMATMGGARAIHMEDKIGSIETGKLADIIIIETKSTNMLPMYDPYSVIVYSSNASNVDTVIVNGKVLVENRSLINVDENLVIEQLNIIEQRVKKIAETL
jgi:cytosine/adenosine deaminase-related metal-dependent hydrolase